MADFQSLDDKNDFLSLLIHILRGTRQVIEEDSINSHLLKLYVGLSNNKDPEKFDYLIKKDFPDIFVYILVTSRRTKNLKLLNTLLSILIYVTNNSENFCAALMNTKFPQLIIMDLIQYSRHIDVEINKSFANESLMVVFNIIRWPKFSVDFQQKVDIVTFKDILVSLSSRNDDIKMVAALVLACLVRDIDRTYIAHLIKLDIINLIITYVTKAGESEDKSYDCFDVWELLLALRALSTINHFREEIFKFKESISTLLKVITLKTSEYKEIEVSFEILKNLSITRDKAEILKTEFKIEKTVETALSNKEESQKKLGKEFLGDFRKRWQEVEHLSLLYDVFLSFSENDINEINKVEEFLRKYLKVYSGSGNNVGITGIKRSKVVILVISKSYNDEDCSKLAAACAYNERKCIIPLSLVYKYRPYGWLKEIVNMDKAVDFSDHSMFKESLKKLCELLQESGINVTNMLDDLQVTASKSLKDGAKTEQYKKRQRSSSRDLLKNCETFNFENLQIVSQDNHFSTWTKEELSEWLIYNQLSEIHNKFNDFDGKMLQKIIEMRNAAREMYYNHLSTSLKMSFKEIIKFECALDKLEY